MKLKTYLFVVSIFCFFSSSAQMADGSIAPDVSFTDINGNAHNLYDILDSGKSVIFDVSATWCPPCWNYHRRHILSDLYEEYGPGGRDEVEIFLIESDFRTNEDCLHNNGGCNASTLGDWVQDTPYPIVNTEFGNASNFNSLFQLGFYPTIYKICPNKRTYFVGAPSFNNWETWISSCQMDATAEVTNGVCYDPNATFSIDQTVENGYGTITYKWSNGETQQDLNNLDPGIYTCTLTDSHGHEVVAGPYYVDAPSSALEVDLEETESISCFGEVDGELEAEASGGGNFYDYYWSTGSPGSSISNLGSGNYTVTVVDLYGCEEIRSIEIEEPEELDMRISSTEADCGVANGSMRINPDGGTSPYFYDIGNGVSPSNLFSNLEAGSYMVTLTDANGCTLESEGIVDGEIGPLVEAGPDLVIDCQGGELIIDATNSEAGDNINYLWSTSDGNIVSGSSSSSPVVNAPGVYLITVLDTETGCEKTDEVSIITEGPTVAANQLEELNCFNGAATLDASLSDIGSNISYLWLDDNGNEVGNEITVEVSLGGNYTLVVTNTDDGCSSTTEIDIESSIELPEIVSFENVELSCDETEITLTGEGSAAGEDFEYSWYNEDGDFLSSDLELNISVSGIYEFVVFNSMNGCSSIAEVEVVENTNLPNADAGISMNLNCIDETLVIGGASSEGDNISYRWTDPFGNFLGNSIDEEVDFAGLYQLVVIDNSNGCSSTSTVEIGRDIKVPNVNIISEGTVINCEISTLLLEGSGSETGAEITYSWIKDTGEQLGSEIELEVSQAGTYELVVTNSNNGCTNSQSIEIIEAGELPEVNIADVGELTCLTQTVVLDGSNSANGTNISYVWLDANSSVLANDSNVEVQTAGIYELIVEDSSNGCSSSSVVEVLENLESPIATVEFPSMLSCIQSSVMLDGAASSNGENFVYEWFDADNNLLSSDMSLEVTSTGIYNLIVSNTSNGCSMSTIVEVLEDFDTPVADAGAEMELNCNENNLFLDGTASSQNANYSYEWFDQNGNSIGSELTQSVSQEGIYNLVVTNNDNGCSSDSSVEVISNVENPDVIVSSDGQLDCENALVILNGSDSSTGSNFAYAWLSSNGTTIGTEINIEVSSADTYTLVVTNLDNGCSGESALTIQASLDVPQVVINSLGELDCLNGTVQLDANQSTSGADFEYIWTNDEGQEIGEDLELDINQAGTYTLNISNLLNGCSASSSIVIAQDLNVPSIVLEIPAALDCSNPSTIIDASASNGTNTLSYNWLNENEENIGNQATLNISSPGTYTLILSDNINGCSSTEEITVLEDAEIPNASAEASGNLNCNSLEVLLESQETSEDNSYLWMDASGNIIDSNSPSILVEEAGMYTLLVTNLQNSCSSETSIEVSQVENPSINLGELTHIDCDASSLGEAFINITGDAAPFEVSWSNGNSSLEVLDLAAGQHTVEIVDANGCTDLVEFEITQPELVEIDLVSIVDNSCADDNNGSIDIGVEGEGVFTYQWSNGAQTEDIANLSSGIYSLILTDQNGCEQFFEATIAAEDSEAPLVIVQNISLNLDSNGQASLSPEMIDNGSSDNCAVVNFEINRNIFDCENLGENEVELHVYDESGNSNYEIAIVTIVDDISPTIICMEDIVVTDCEPVEYPLPEVIDNCSSYVLDLMQGFDSGASFPEGRTTVEYLVTDASGNQATCSFDVIVEKNLELDITGINPTCVGTNDGYLQAVVYGDFYNYSFQWSTGETTSIISDLLPGLYTVTINYYDACEVVQEYLIENPDPITISILNIINDTNSSGSGGAEIEVFGGTGLYYTYEWFDENGVLVSTSMDLYGVVEGEYTLVATDRNGCSSNPKRVIIENVVPTSTIDVSDEIILDVYPTPTKGNVNIKILLSETKAIQLDILDLNGKVIERYPQEKIKESSLYLDLNHLSAGVYLGRFTVGNHALLRKIVLID